MALGFVERGHQATDIAGQHGYDDQERLFPKREIWRGIEIRRIVAKGVPAEKVVIIPTGSLDNQVQFDATGREAFRHEHGLTDKFVVGAVFQSSPVAAHD